MAFIHRYFGKKHTQQPNKPFLSPTALGSVAGLSLAGFFLLGGYDAYQVFFTNEIQTVPAWVHLITVPIGKVPWPTSWVLLSFITLLSAIWAKNQLSGRWWLIVFSAPMLWELWSGQIEWMPVLGAVIAMKVMDLKLPRYWLGVALLLLLAKPWVGWGTALILLIKSLRVFGWKPLLPALFTALGIIALTLIVWPTWITDFARHMFAYEDNEINGALWPVGALSWLLVPNMKTREISLKRIAAASLLTSPYLRLYHSLLLLTFDDEVSSFIVGWGILATTLFGLEFRVLAWVLPLFVLVREKILELRAVPGGESSPVIQL